MRLLFSVALFAMLLINPAMAMEEMKDSPVKVEGSTLVTSKEAKALFDEGVVFFDVRETPAFEMGRIPSSVHLDVMTNAFTQAALEAEAKPMDKKVIYCNGIKCARSSLAIAKAVSYGHKNIYYFREGFPGWKAAGFPVE